MLTKEASHVMSASPCFVGSFLRQHDTVLFTCDRYHYIGCLAAKSTPPVYYEHMKHNTIACRYYPNNRCGYTVGRRAGIVSCVRGALLSIISSQTIAARGTQ